MTKKYGLKDEDLNEIIIMENLRDVTHEFSEPIHSILDKFGSTSKMRILEFNELSGADREAKEYFNVTILAQKHLFYAHLSSNRDCCVIYHNPNNRS